LIPLNNNLKDYYANIHFPFNKKINDYGYNIANDLIKLKE